MLILARDARGLTQAELAGRLKIGQGTLSKYETGFLEPPLEFIEDLARALGFPVSLFFEPGRPYGLPPFHYRRRKKLSAKALARIVAEINIRRIHLNKLLQSYEWKTNGFIPEIDPDEYRGRGRGPLTTEDVARLVRET
jgi:transcriptional regulator with XRE-family HTH domain